MRKTLIFLTLAISLLVVNANVLGFDFGNTFFKITLVRPGSPFSIVENTTSMRKTQTMLTIADDVRLWSADSFVGAARYPKTTFANVAGYLGKDFSQDELESLRADRFVLNDFVEDERGLVAMQTFSIEKSDEQTIYYTEEVVAMILKYGRTLSEIQVGNGATVKDAVITIPSYFNQEQRRMMLDAAEIAGLHVISLMHENVAAATMFAIDRLDEEKSLNVLFYNMGGIDTEVTIAKYSTVQDDKNKVFEHVEILAESFDSSLGGEEFDKVLVDMMVDAFDKMPERKGKPSVRTNDRSMKRLFKESVKVKDILSANKIADVKVPELLDYVTLRTVLERTDFELKSKHLLDRIAHPVQEVLKKSGLTLKDIDQVEILGGGLRIPRVHELIKAATGKQELMVHLNGDEAMCFGAAFIAANSSSSFKVRKVFLTQHPSFGYRIAISPIPEQIDSEESEITYNKDLTLFKKTDYLGQKKTVALNYDKNMRLDVFAVHENDKEEHLATYIIDDLEDISKDEIAKKENSTLPKVSLQFELTRSHILQLNKVEAKIDEQVRQAIKPNKTVATNDTKKANSTKSESKKTNSTKSDSKVEKEAKEDEETDASQQEDEVELVEEEIQYEDKIVTHSYPITPNETLHGVRLLSKEQKTAAKLRIKALEKRDKDKFQTDEAKNTFEALIYEFRGWLQDEENAKYVEESERESLIEKCNAGEEWIYEAGSDVGYKEYQTKGYDLQSAYSKLKTRKQEHQTREEQMPVVMSGLQEMRDRLPEILEQKPWITQDEGKDLADKISEMRSWLTDKLKEQAKVSLHEDPTITAEAISNKLKNVTRLYKKVTEKKKPKEKKAKEPKEEDKKEEEKQSEDENAEL